MDLFGRLFGGNKPDDGGIRKACDSDVLTEIVEAIGNDPAKCKEAVKYLDECGNLSMKLRVLGQPCVDANILILALLVLDTTDAPKINRVCKDGFNPVLQFSLCRGKEIAIRALAHANANLDVVGANGVTPLTLACETGLAANVRMLIANGARAFDVCDGSGWAPLHYACQLGNPEMTAALLGAGANVNKMSRDRLMPIHVAISTVGRALTMPNSPTGIPWSPQGALECVRMLVDAGADIDYTCPYGFSARDFLRKIGASR